MVQGSMHAPMAHAQIAVSQHCPSNPVMHLHSAAGDTSGHILQAPPKELMVPHSC